MWNTPLRVGRRQPRDPRESRSPRRRRSITYADLVEAAIWTAIGLLAATSLGTLFYLGSRMDALASRLDARMDALGSRLDSRMDGGFARVDARFDAIEARLDGLAARLDTHLDQHAG